MMKDEGPYVIEWVAHHLAVGFTDFVIYTNDCTDGTDKMLTRMQELGLVQHRNNAIPEGMKPQPSALKYAQVEPEVAASDWLLVFDADEFLCLRHGDGRIDTLISDIKATGANGMVITWRIFGSGGVHEWSTDPVTEQYLMAAPQMWNKGWGVKTLFQFDPDKWKLGIHRPKLKNKVLDTEFPDSVRWLNGSGREMEEYFKFRGWRSIVRTVGYDWAQMNHYAIKSIDAYAIRRLRGNVNNKADKYNADYWSLQDRNEVHDDTMLRYKPERDRIIAALLSDPVLAELHDAALTRTEETLARIRDTEAYRDLVVSLKAASQVPITQVSAAPPKPRDKAKIASLMSDVEKRASGKRRAEKVKSPEARTLPPTDLYVRGSVDVSADVPLDWVQNHSVRLPMDPRIFTPAALTAIEVGKFQRNLARNVPGLVPKGGTFVDYGGACGFLAFHLAQTRPDAQVTLHEPVAGFRVAQALIAQENEITELDNFTLAGAENEKLGAILRKDAPAVLAIGGSVSIDEVLRSLEDLPEEARPGAIIFHGRALVEETGALSDAEARFFALGYNRRLPLDVTMGVGFAREDDV
ncbi:MAG: glycosyltransferase family 2 protein [Alphaproteobacteria bacterium]|nr:glycosyltransferase family 2 protein [Alphaproteobacteria bacterium]